MSDQEMRLYQCTSLQHTCYEYDAIIGSIWRWMSRSCKAEVTDLQTLNVWIGCTKRKKKIWVTYVEITIRIEDKVGGLQIDKARWQSGVPLRLRAPCVCISVLDHTLSYEKHRVTYLIYGILAKICLDQLLSEMKYTSLYRSKMEVGIRWGY